MAGQASPKRSPLEADDGCHFCPVATKNLFGSGSGGMDVCDSAQICDSGVSMTSLGCEGMPSLGVFDPIKPRFNYLETPTTCVSVGYSSMHEDSGALEGQMEGLCISSCSETVTTTSTQTAPCTAVEAEPVDPHKAFVDRVEFYFTPDEDGDT